MKEEAHRSKMPIVIASCFTPVPLSLGTAMAWRYLMRGHDAVLIPHHLRDMRNLERYAGHIAEIIATTLRSRLTAKINLVGMSMGGVAALYAVKKYGLAPHLTSFICISSPFQGTTLGWLGKSSLLYSETGTQLMPGSDWLRRLHATPLPQGPRYVTIAGKRDLVCQPSAAELDGAEFVLRDYGHMNMIHMAEIHELALSFCV